MQRGVHMSTSPVLAFLRCILVSVPAASCIAHQHQTRAPPSSAQILRPFRRCGTSTSYTRPQPSIDPRGSLTELERLQTPYDFYMSPTCRDKVSCRLQACLACSAAGKPWRQRKAADRAAERWNPRPMASEAFHVHVQPGSIAFCVLPSTSSVQVKQYFAAITGRRNTITGLLYRDDPTIMSWASRGRQIAV